MLTAYTNGTIYTGSAILQNKTVLTEAGKITGIINENEIPSSFNIIDLQQKNLAPAFIDLQIYGGNGKMFSHHLDTESLQRTYEYCKAGGAPYFLITIATNDMAVVFKGIEIIKQYWQQGGKGVLGLHVEGPYLNPIKRGAHPLQYIKKPTREEVTELLKAGKDVIKIITLAPEMCDDEIIKIILDNNIIVSAGHSNATYDEAMHGFDLRIPMATHLFNAMSPLQSRQPGMVGAIYNHKNIVATLVADGVHVDFAAIQISKKIMGERLMLITDAVTEIKEGVYIHQFKENKYTLPDGTLSGSALTMMKAVENCVKRVDIPLDEALRMASLYPAKIMKMDDQYGRIEKGFNTSFVIFDNDYIVHQVVEA